MQGGNNRMIPFSRRYSQHAALAILMAALLSAAGGTTAGACGKDCAGSAAELAKYQKTLAEEYMATRTRLETEFEFFKTWLKEQLSGLGVEMSLAETGSQTTAAAMNQVAAIGAMMDAENQMRAQRTLQELSAQAQKDYQPSTGMCTIGTNIQGLAASESLAQANSAVMNRWSLDRQTGAGMTGAAQGEPADRRNRLEQFKRRYCDSSDNNAGMKSLCGDGSPLSTANKDIDFGRTIDARTTLDIDFTDSTLTDDEQDVLALAGNLYTHRVPFRIPENVFRTAAKTKILDLRSVIAKRSVAQSSFFTIAGMKSQGSGGASVAYMQPILAELGMKPQEISATLGPRPSYDAQMEFLTRKIYQRPGFFTDLYDKPANVLRKTVSMQAIGLMQDFDTLQSTLRTEAMLSLILELEVMKLQSEVQRKVATLKAEGVRLE